MLRPTPDPTLINDRHPLIILAPTRLPKINDLSLMQAAQGQLSFAQRQAMFVVASTLSSMGKWRDTYCPYLGFMSIAG